MQSGSAVTAETAAPHHSAYVEQHRAAWIPDHYDHEVYRPDGYDAFIWSLQQPLILRTVRQFRRTHRRLNYLDFACGTGRIIAAVETQTTSSIGIDTSPQMVERAQSKVSRSSIVCGDILADPQIVAHDFDVITAFRFFLNTEDEMRAQMMPALAQRLAGNDALLVFNIHGNSGSVLGITSRYRRLRGWGALRLMSYGQAKRLANAAGLEIVAWYGFGLFPMRCYRSRLAPVARRLDRWAVRFGMLRRVSHDLVFICRPANRA